MVGFIDSMIMQCIFTVRYTCTLEAKNIADIAEVYY